MIKSNTQNENKPKKQKENKVEKKLIKNPDLEKINVKPENKEQYNKLLEKYKTYSPHYNRPRTSKTPNSNKNIKKQRVTSAKGGKTINEQEIKKVNKSKENIQEKNKPIVNKIKPSTGTKENKTNKEKMTNNELLERIKNNSTSPFSKKKKVEDKTNSALNVPKTGSEKEEKKKQLKYSKSQKNFFKKEPSNMNKSGSKINIVENKPKEEGKENEKKNINQKEKESTIKETKKEKKSEIKEEIKEIEIPKKNEKEKTEENKLKGQKKMVKSCSQPNLAPKKKVVKKIYKIKSLSQVGFSGLGVKKVNQDNFFIYKNLNDEEGVYYIGVVDGHGVEGHHVSKYLINHLPQNLNKELKKTKKYIHDKENLEKTLNSVFVDTNKDLCEQKNIDTQFSGSTCVTIILKKNKIISANAGDSRAVLGRCIDGKWEAIELSRDHKPNDPDESKRIISRGGRIEAYKDENGADFGPKRIWLKDQDYPGLAMSRSFGDRVAASVGAISEPEIKYFDLVEEDKFIIVASDGIWEFISSQDCVNIIKDYYLKKDLVGCLKYLLNESSSRWITEEQVIDDITAVLIFFEDS
ncbi:MAG: protein phosphatase 2C domain-containing protein [archaeon]|nr:protein phosphatase 2C domain-containing protein [archaeon]